jgi:Cu(I)/Ag(I) efflux system membrane fusion protein
MAVAGMRIDPAMTLYRIADLSTVWLQADIYESELPLVKTGQTAHVTLPSLPGHELRGTVSYIDPVLNPATRSARVRIALDNRNGLLKPDMYANVALHVELGERLVVPESALLRTGERQIVFVDKGDGTFEMRPVLTGVHGEGWYEVLEGIAEGERVVASANFLIDAESRVQGVMTRLEGDTTATAAPAHRH